MKGKEWIGRWSGRTVVCIASGPSLSVEDCEAVRLARDSAGGNLIAITTNTSFRAAPWADVLFAFDAAWLREYHAEVAAKFAGAVVSASSEARRYGAQSLHGQTWFKGFGFSGSSALSLAVIGGAKKVVLLGYDAQKTNGRSHWHGAHPATLTDARSIGTWPRRFEQVASYARAQRCEVVNASRETALRCFPRIELAAAL